ncbi:response regulator [Bacillus sp. FJAT-42376]|uniref:GGDEF domain-containing response regulator n=1 Tax=Bacillus sp. FJAT-42376 TaxID=2014076 RepID=UPI000F4D3CD0|nr:response regulator [Bacillus sp. FJAT-42376]AZB44195.1 response regulator [Bacillus sp. FJAT-42376]
MMEKYKIKLLENIRKQLQSWHDGANDIEGGELYKFLHSLAGTAPTIGLPKIGRSAAVLMKEAEEKMSEKWPKELLQSFLSPLLSIAYDEEADREAGHSLSAGFTAEEKDLVMLIDDDPALLMYVKDALEQEGFAVMAFTEASKALRAFFDLDPSCVIIDVHMEESSGLDILEEFKRYTNYRFTPAVMMSVDDTKETRMKSYQLDADDFIPKPFDLDELILRVSRLVTKKKNMKELIMLDELTRVYTRKHLLPSFTRLAEQMERENQPFSAALIDLDHFKSINDTYGHLMGDRVLRDFAEMLKKDLRTGDLPFRYGGEEFLVLFPRTDTQRAEQILHRMLDQFMSKEFKANKDTFSVSFSAGVASADRGKGMEKTIETADHALYRAKQEGRAKILSEQNPLAIKPVRRALRFAIVDDDPIVRTILKDLLENSGLEKKFTLSIQTFEDGFVFCQSGWHEEGKDASSFIILDGMMPKMDGIEVLKMIRSLKDQERYTVVMLTNRTSEKDIEKALKLGADDYLTKPFKLAEIESRIRHLLKKISS